MRVRVGKTCLFVLMAASLSIHLNAEGIPCWIRCRCPPRILTAADVSPSLRSSVNPSLRLVARGSGILTTYLGKLLGVQGWRDYHLAATVRGNVVHAAGSTDGLYTIDVQIDQLYLDSQPVRLGFSPAFIRIEVFPFARIGAPLPVRKNDPVCVSGKLMWDADGFLEIHPKRPSDFAERRCQRAIEQTK
jgi:hypothetical protein